MRAGFGAIDLLLGLLVTAIVFMLMMPMIKGGGSSLNTSNQHYESVQEHVNKQVEEIEQMRDQQIKYSQESENQAQ